MDKYEYQVCTEKIKELIAQKRFAEAVEIVDTIDWRRVRSVSMLVTASEIYKVNKRYEDAKDILLLAYERHPNGRDIVYALCELFIKLGDIVQAIESYKEFMAIAPDDANSCILLYKIYKAQDVSLEEQIDVLEEYKRRDYREKWAYELAYLYHRIGEEAKCVAECDELILWFGEGKYVRKAMELKMQHSALTKEQQAKYDSRHETTSLPKFEQPVSQNTQFGNNAQQTGPMINQYGEYILETGQLGTTGQLGITGQLNSAGQAGIQGGYNNVPYQNNNQMTPEMSGPIYVDAYGNQFRYDMYGNPVPVTNDVYNNQSQSIQVTPEINHLGMTQDIMAQALGTSAWNAAELQNQIGSEVREAMTDDSDIHSEPIIEEDLTQMMPQARIEKEADETEETEEAQEKPKTISVHTGVIDLSDTGDILSKLDGVIPGTSPEITGVTSTVHGPKQKSRITGEIPDVLPSVNNTGEIPKSVNSVKHTGEIYPPAGNEEESDTDTEVKYEIKDQVETREEEISRISAVSEKAFNGFVAPDISEAIKDEEEPVKEPEADESTDASIEIEDRETEEIIEDRDNEKPEEKLIPVGDNQGKYPYDTVTDIGFVEELPEIDQPEDVDEILKTGKIPSDEVSRATSYETDSIEEVEEIDEDDDDDKVPAYMRTDIRASREFDDDEYKIFCRYDGMQTMKAQLVMALDLMSMEPDHGNIVITGSESVDTKGIAISIVKAMQSKNPSFSGKVAKISGEALNKKNIKVTLEKLENGALIVERAGGLTQESVVMITSTLEDSIKPVLVLFEGTKETIKPLYKYSKSMKSVFNARIDITEYTDEDLVNYGRGYALEKEYSIDEMGGLALHNRISELQTFDHKVTIEEVKEIIDMAIKHVDKKNMGHLMDMLLGRRYDDEDNIILSEKDFIF